MSYAVLDCYSGYQYGSFSTEDEARQFASTRDADDEWALVWFGPTATDNRLVALFSMTDPNDPLPSEADDELEPADDDAGN